MVVLISAAPAILLAGSTGFFAPFSALAAIPESATLVLSGLALMLVARVARRMIGRTASETAL